MSVRTTLEQMKDRASSRSVSPNFPAEIVYGCTREKMYRTGATNGGGASSELHGEAQCRWCFELGSGGEREEGFESNREREKDEDAWRGVYIA